MIKKRGSKFVVTNKAGTKVLGTHPSKEAAAKQLAAIEISKAKHMSEQKRFKAFRSELNESEYKETLTGYPNRGIDTDVGAVKHDADTLQKINGVLAALGRYTYQHTAEAMIKIRTRLNLFMIDFPWTPWMWQSNPTGTFTLNATLFGRVDGVDALTGGIRMDGKANPNAGMKEFALVVTVEPAEDGFYRVNAKLQPQIAVMPEGVEHDGDPIEEMAQTPARQREMARKIQRAEDKAQSGYFAKMTQSGKAGTRGRKQEAKYDAASRRLIARDTKEYESSKLYGRGGKVVKGKRKPVKEEAEQIEEMLKAGDKVKVPHKGKMVRGRIVRHDSGGSGKAQQHGGGYVVDVGEYASITVPGHKVVKEAAEQIDELSKKTLGSYIRKASLDLARKTSDVDMTDEYGLDTNKARVERKRKKISQRTKGIGQAVSRLTKEEVEQIDELSKATKDSYVAKRGSQLSSMLSGHTRGKQLTGKQQANAVKGIKQAMGVKEELIGGQKRLDVNKNKRLDAQDFAMLRAKKKPMKEYTETMGGIPLTAPDPTAAMADKSGKGKRFHKGAIKSVAEAVAKGKKPKKPSTHQGAANVISKQKAIKSRLEKHDMRW
jgi:hypothetical protein